MAASYDELGSGFAAAGFVAEGFLTPWRARCFGGTVAATVTTAVRVIGSGHDNAANGWAKAFVARAAGFANLNVLVLLVADNAQ